MAVGDIVNGIRNDGSDLVFQPAIGVSIMITAGCSRGQWISATNGVVSAVIYESNKMVEVSMKLMINNTNYLTLPTDADGEFYSGIQIQ